jgi:phenylacetate-CoA ligase
VRRLSLEFLLPRIVLPLGDLLAGQRMIARLDQLREAQWWDYARLSEFREEAFKNLISTAYNEVPFYREIMDQERLKPADFKSSQDLGKLPVISKQMLRNNYPDKTTRPTGFRNYETSSSGSTGQNFFVREDTYTAGWYRASFLLSMEWAGWRIGKAHLQTGMNLSRDLYRTLKDLFFQCHYVSAFDLTDQNLDLALSIIDKYKIKYLWGYPGSLYYLAKRAQQVGFNQTLISASTWGDNLFPHYRKTISNAFKCNVFDTYGCGEGMQVAAQCEVQDHYHIHSLDVIVEYIKDDQSVAATGEGGNIVLTRLHPGAMPFIRYKVGDIGVSGRDMRCSCGREFEILKAIEGRDTDVIITPSGNRLIVHFFTGIFEHYKEISSFQVVQDSADSIVVKVVSEELLSESLRTVLTTSLKSAGASDMRIHIEQVSDIPTTLSGKRRFVINETLSQN